MNTSIDTESDLPRLLSRIAKATNFPAGAPIYHQGQPVQHVYLIVRGYVRLAVVSRSGDEYVQAVLGHGALFGASLARGASGLAAGSAYALGPVRAYVLSSQQLRSLATQQPELGWGLVERLSAAKDELERRTLSLCHQSVEVRLAGLLHDLLLQYGARCRHGHDVDIRLTHQDLADLIGASRPVVSGLLMELRRRGVIAYTRRFICVDDAEALRRIVED